MESFKTFKSAHAKASLLVEQVVFAKGLQQVCEQVVFAKGLQQVCEQVVTVFSFHQACCRQPSVGRTCPMKLPSLLQNANNLFQIYQ